MSKANTILDADSLDQEQVDNHPSIQTLDAYLRGGLSANEVAQNRRHLVFCRECSETLLDLAEFLEESPEPSRLWSAELTVAWEEWLAALKRREKNELPALQEDLEPAAR